MLGSPPAAMAGSPKRGLRVFETRCAACHTVVIHEVRYGGPASAPSDQQRAERLEALEALRLAEAVDLTTWARQQTPRKILQWLRLPPPLDGKAHFPRAIKRMHAEDLAAFFWRATKDRPLP